MYASENSVYEQQLRFLDILFNFMDTKSIRTDVINALSVCIG